MACSQIFASSGMPSGIMVSKATPPAQSSALWHLLQYCLRNAQCSSPPGAAGVAFELCSAVAATGAGAPEGGVALNASEVIPPIPAVRRQRPKKRLRISLVPPVRSGSTPYNNAPLPGRVPATSQSVGSMLQSAPAAPWIGRRRDFLTAALGSAVGLSLAELAPIAAFSAEAADPIVAAPLSGDLTVFGGAGCNVVAARDRDGVLLVDGGLEARSKELLEAVSRAV